VGHYSLKMLLTLAALGCTDHRMSPVFHGNSTERTFTW
jgi:hypothetical protein